MELPRGAVPHVDPAHPLPLADVCDSLGITAHTARYYEREGLLAVPRDAAGHRVFDEAALRRLTFLVRMRSSGMGIADLRRYVALVRAGDATRAERLRLMQEHRTAILARIRELELSLAATDYKIATYGGALGDVPGAETTTAQEAS